MDQSRKTPKQMRHYTLPDQSIAENHYYARQMQDNTPLLITLSDGEVLKGSIASYDRSCIKVDRDGQPNVLIYKSNIKYMHKDE